MRPDQREILISFNSKRLWEEIFNTLEKFCLNGEVSKLKKAQTSL